MPMASMTATNSAMRPELRRNLVQPVALEQNAPHDPQEMGQRQDFADATAPRPACRGTGT